MADFLYRSCIPDIFAGNIVVGVDDFKAMLLGASYTPNARTHAKRSDLTDEISGTGYTTGGIAASVSTVRNDAGGTIIVLIDPLIWTGATFSTRWCGIYKARGGAASADELVALLDFGAVQSPSGITFAVPSCSITVRYVGA